MCERDSLRFHLGPYPALFTSPSAHAWTCLPCYSCVYMSVCTHGFNYLRDYESRQGSGLHRLWACLQHNEVTERKCQISMTLLMVNILIDCDLPYSKYESKTNVFLFKTFSRHFSKYFYCLILTRCLPPYNQCTVMGLKPCTHSIWQKQSQSICHCNCMSLVQRQNVTEVRNLWIYKRDVQTFSWKSTNWNAYSTEGH